MAAGRPNAKGTRLRPQVLLLFLAYAAKLSGGDRHLLEMAARWRNDVDLAVAAPPRALDTVHDFLGDVEVHTIGSSPPIGARLAIEYIRRSVTAFTRRLPAADIAAASSHFSPDAAGLAALVRRGALGVGYVYHLVADRGGRGPRTIWSRNDERLGLALLRRHADLVFVSNRETELALARRGLQPVRTDVGIDLAQFKRTNRRRVPHRGLFVGRMVPSKGVRDVVEAWAMVAAGLPDAELLLAGEGPERDGALALAGELGIASAVTPLGFVSEDKKRRLLQESSVLVAPSYEEGWGIAVCEALASGTPVVGYRLPVLDELFPESYAGVPVGDSSALAEMTVRVLTDPSLAASLAAKGRETAARYDVERVAAAELDEILRRYSARRSERA